MCSNSDTYLIQLLIKLGCYHYLYALDWQLHCLSGQFAFIYIFDTFFLILKLCSIPRSHKYWHSQSGMYDSKTAFRIHSERNSERVRSERLTLKEPCCLHHFIQTKSADLRHRCDSRNTSQMSNFSLYGICM